MAAPTCSSRSAPVRRAIDKRSFATLATTSPAGRPHVAGVLFEALGDTLYINTLRSSRKALNVAANSQAAICVPMRRLPIGPPSTVQFQTTAHIVELDAPEIEALVGAGELTSITGHGELDEPDGCFLRLAIPHRLVTYGLGMSIRKLIADPLNAGGIVASRPEQARAEPRTSGLDRRARTQVAPR